MRYIVKIRKYVTEESANLVVHALVISKLDNCNLLLYGLPNHLLSWLKSVQNHAARIIKFTRKFDPITPVLRGLHWLPVRLPVSFFKRRSMVPHIVT